MANITRAEAVALFKQMMNGPEQIALERDASSIGRLEVEVLLDAIYGEPKDHLESLIKNRFREKPPVNWRNPFGLTCPAINGETYGEKTH